MLFNFLKNFFFIAVVLSSCTTVKDFQPGKPFVFKNTVEVKGGDFSNDERNSLKQKMLTLLDDSMKTSIKELLFIYKSIKAPPAYDSAYAAISGTNMKNSFVHQGYYNATDSFKADTVTKNVFKFFKFRSQQQQRVSVNYIVKTGPPTRIDTMAYNLKIPDMQRLALATKERSYLKKPDPVSRLNVLSEISRLVELYRNNGYYKVTPDDIKLLGDTTIESLTNISDDPFENLQKLAEASLKRNKPTIKLAMVQNPNADTARLKRFYIGNIIIYPDIKQDDINTESKIPDDTASGNIIRWYHKKIFKNNFLLSNIYIKKDSLYNQEAYNKTISSFSRHGIWQNVNIEIKESNDSTGKLDMLVQLLPAKPFGFESNIEASYSANSNTNNVSAVNAGNLLGFSGNISLQNRNWLRQGIKMTHSIRAGVELNLNKERRAGQRINSSEISYSNTISLPKLIFPFRKWNTDTFSMPTWWPPFRKWNKKELVSKQSFVNSSISSTNRIGLFKLFSLGINIGNEFSFKAGESFIVKALNIEYSNLYNRSDDFNQTLEDNPFLKYSYNTALVIGQAAGFSKTWSKKDDHINTLNLSVEESGFLLPFFFMPLDKFGLLKSNLKKFAKFDAEYIYTIRRQRSERVFRLFVGVGTPIGSKDKTLPFFKQYFAGGANSMRGWPVRGLGPGSKNLTPYNSRFLSDRTGDIRIEANAEFRYHIAQLIPNTLVLKGALFADIGNVWNSRNTYLDGRYDSSQFKFKNLYKELGVNLGTGFRFDFNYVVLRVDLGFRFKRPELAENGGWKAPNIGFDDLFKKLFGRGNENEYRIWRYENFNFTIGLNYPF